MSLCELFFFFKQKTAYELRISDWSSDVCSSDLREVANAEEEGIEFVWLSAPEAFLGDGAVQAVRAQRVHLGMPDATGRQTPQLVEGSHFTLEADMVLKALGFDPGDLPRLFDSEGLEVPRWGDRTRVV